MKLVIGEFRLFRRLAYLAGLALAFVFLPSSVLAQKARHPIPDSDCLACHGQKDLKSAAGASVFVDEAAHKAGAHSILNCTDCHADIKEVPHQARVAKVNCAACHSEEAADFPKSVHSVLGADGCVACHGSAHAVKPAVLPQPCNHCHSDEVKDFLSSIHGQAAQKGDPQAPTCLSCHGPVHKIIVSQDPASPVAKKNLPDTCAACHSDPVFLAKHQIPFAQPVEMYKVSAHGRAIAAGNENAASCSDCHGSHAIYEARDPRSKVNHWNVPSTCGACHTEIAKTYSESVHGKAVALGATDAPVCTDCHGEHVILAPSEPSSLVNPARVSLVTCGRCHGNTTIDARYNLPADRVPSFADSYHGLASRAGSQTVANCASCHGVHNIFPSSDPRSTVNPANLAHTCGACHTGAGKSFAIGPVHVLPETRSEHPVIKFIRHLYWILIPLTFGFMFLHHLLDFLPKLLRKKRVITPAQAAFRLNPHFRVAHALTLISFPVLVFTGFALKFPESWWARPMLLWERHFALRGTIHRAAAVVLLLSLGYHLMHLILDGRARTIIRRMKPRVEDVWNLRDVLRFNLGFSPTRPVLEEFSYVEKTEYLAFMWGTIVMSLTGFLMWFNSFSLRHFPKWTLDAATALHYYEAILATGAILIWHMYLVIFDPDVYPMDRVVLRDPHIVHLGSPSAGPAAPPPSGAAALPSGKAPSSSQQAVPSEKSPAARPPDEPKSKAE
ncbi:MAG TPA: cytochrome b/b6 domain-containing protein [Candidatus Acidoferrales bacterium]|nr:cytochrome b/b6 domain-containing protein [Candidatus Acidoferrales bacterium]